MPISKIRESYRARLCLIAAQLRQAANEIEDGEIREGAGAILSEYVEELDTCADALRCLAPRYPALARYAAARATIAD